MTPTGTTPVEFSRRLAVAGLEADGRPFRIEAEAAERAALARRFDLRAVDSLICEGVATPEGDGRRVRVTGRLTAAVVQTCGVSLEPLPARINVAVLRLYDAAASDEWSFDAVEGAEIIISGKDDAPDPLDEDGIDLGEMAAEILALELDPFPRRADVSFDGYGAPEDGPDGGTDGDAVAKNPFAVLKSFRPRTGPER